MTNEEILDVSDLERNSRQELITIAQSMELDKNGAFGGLRKEEMVIRIVHGFQNPQGLRGSGILEIMHDGYGFLRQNGLKPGPGDIYVSQSQTRRFGLRSGDTVLGQVRAPRGGERYFGLVRVDKINDLDPSEAKIRPAFEDLTPIFPNEKIILETDSDNLTTRMIDVFAPIGRGQRGLIVAPPKAGKTTILKEIAAGTAANNPDIFIMVVLIGERPEEVTDMRRSINGEVFASTFDESVEDQWRLADMSLERAKRSTRACNLALPSSGRTLSGGIDPVALYPPKKFFGAARNVEDGGSLTIIANCLVDTGSRMDEVIYEEFKGTGNMELHLDRKLAEKRIFPAIDIGRSSTRREELFYDDTTTQQIVLLRRMVGLLGGDSVNGNDVTATLLERLKERSNNSEFLTNLARDATRNKSR